MFATFGSYQGNRSKHKGAEACDDLSLFIRGLESPLLPKSTNTFRAGRTLLSEAVDKEVLRLFQHLFTLLRGASSARHHQYPRHTGK